MFTTLNLSKTNLKKGNLYIAFWNLKIRFLLKKQNGRCAISGIKLDPKDTSIDHILPISRKEFNNNSNFC